LARLPYLEAGVRYGRLMRDLRATVPPDRFLEVAFAALRERVRQEPGWYRLHYELYALATILAGNPPTETR
jgi:hypothetical protein